MARRKGSGTIARHRDGYRVRAYVDGRRTSLGVYPTYEAAEEALAAARLLVGPRCDLTLLGWGETWLDARELDGVHRSVGKDRARWASRIAREEWATCPLRALTTGIVRQWVRKMEADGLAPSTVRNALNLLRVALEDAVEAGHVAENVARPVRVRAAARVEQAWTVLDAAEVEKVTTSPAVPEDARLVFTVAVYTGLRPCELWGLRWRDVHTGGDRPRLVVARSRGKATKTGKPREVPLLPPARAALERWRELRPGVGDALVWPADGGGIRGDGDDYGWASTTRANVCVLGWKWLAGVTRRARFYDLRHTCASHLARGTWGVVVPLPVVRDWLGHQNVRTTERYAHLDAAGLHGLAADLSQNWPQMGPRATARTPRKVPR